MALFGKKKDSSGEGEGIPVESADLPTDTGAAEQRSPENAAKFFSHARTTLESSNYEYSAQLWLRGLTWDPSDLQAVKSFIHTAQKFSEQSSKKGPSKDIAKVAADAKGNLRRYLQALVDCGFKPGDLMTNLKLAEAAAGVEAREVADLFAQRAMTLAQNDKKPRKEVFRRLMKVFEAAENFQLAVVAGERAYQLDPSDGDLQAAVRNMMAQQTISSGHFEAGGDGGGFRKNIRDAQRQAELEASDRLVRTDAEKDQLVEAARRDFEANPDDPVLIDRYGRELLTRNKPGDLIRAMNHYTQAYQRTKQYRFRQKSGEIQLRIMRQNLARQQQLVSQNPDDQDAKAKLESMQQELHRVELEELKLRVENYPTDLAAKYELGRKLYEMGQYGDSIEFFQAAADDPKHKGEVLAYMGRAFMHIDGWENEAIQTLRHAIELVQDEKSDFALELRYDLMLSLYSKAKRDRDRASAEEADALAASIAMQKFNFRDIRDRRSEIKALLEELKD